MIGTMFRSKLNSKSLEFFLLFIALVFFHSLAVFFFFFSISLERLDCLYSVKYTTSSKNHLSVAVTTTTHSVVQLLP